MKLRRLIKNQLMTLLTQERSHEEFFENEIHGFAPLPRGQVCLFGCNPGKSLIAQNWARSDRIKHYCYLFVNISSAALPMGAAGLIDA